MANETNLDNSAEDRTIEALLDIIKQANSPEVWEAQTILLRRLALQGDVVGSRVPAPRNISEIGGYLNLLAELQQFDMRAQVLAGILGVAGPNPPLGWLPTKPPLSFISHTNNRPDGPSQPSIPLTFAVRSDFSEAILSALKTLKDQGCALPLLAPVPSLSEITSSHPPTDLLPYLGRALYLVPAAALHDPAADPLALARPTGTAEPYRIVARVLAAGQVAVAPADWDVLKCDSSSCAPMAVTGGQFVPVAPALAAAGFYPASPLPEPVTETSTAWARFTNITGLMAGVTKLGDELYRLYRPQDIAGSLLAEALYWVWDGKTFAQP
jgi:hypothetical protein